MSAAYILHKSHKITLFESNSTLGGHTNTINTDNGLSIDTGFIVYNEKNYPNFCKFIDKLDVASIESNMSFAYHDSRSNCGYSSDFPSGLFSTKKNIVSPSFYKFLYEIHRFNTISKKEYSHIPTNLTIYDYLCSHGFSQRLIHEYVIPMGAAIWSTCQKDTLHFPAKTFLSFWDNHCLLQFLNRPKWRTIQGGAQKYIDAVINTTKLNYFTNHPIKKIDRHSNHVTLYGETSGPMEFDLVVIATHADQALRMLSAPHLMNHNSLGHGHTLPIKPPFIQLRTHYHPTDQLGHRGFTPAKKMNK